MLKEAHAEVRSLPVLRIFDFRVMSRLVRPASRLVSRVTGACYLTHSDQSSTFASFLGRNDGLTNFKDLRLIVEWINARVSGDQKLCWALVV